MIMRRYDAQIFAFLQMILIYLKKSRSCSMLAPWVRALARFPVVKGLGMTGQAVQLEANRRWPADVDVWHVAMPRADAPLDASLLDDAERARAAAYRQPGDRVRFTVTRATVRELLGRYLDAAPASLCFTAGMRGRPELRGFPDISWNVSHSGEHALIAVSGARTVGIDIERIDSALDWRELTGLVCTAEELATLMREPVWLQRQSFFRCWTAKEALLKALGLGITEGLRALAVDPAGDGAQRAAVSGDLRFARARHFQYHWLTDISGYMGCIAYGELKASRVRDPGISTICAASR